MIDTVKVATGRKFWLQSLAKPASTHIYTVLKRDCGRAAGRVLQLEMATVKAEPYPNA